MARCNSNTDAGINFGFLSLSMMMLPLSHSIDAKDREKTKDIREKNK